MKVKINSNVLHKKVDNLYKIAKSKTTLPILNYFKVEVTDDNVRLTASDLEVTITANVIPEEVNAVGSICVLADKFTETVKSFKDTVIDLSLDAKGFMILKAKGGKFKIPCFPSEDFPTLREPETEEVISVNSLELVNGLRKTGFTTYKDAQHRPALAGVNVDMQTDKTVFFSTDMARFSAYFSNSLVSFGTSVILPTKYISFVESILSDAVSEVEMSFDDRNIKLDATDYIIYGKKIEAEYPPYEKLINQDVDVIFTLNKQELSDAIVRALTFTSENNVVSVNVLLGKIELAAEDVNFGLSAEEEIASENKQGSGQFRVNGRFMLEILQRMASEQVEISFSDKHGMVYFNPVDKEENCLFGLGKYAQL